MEGSRVSIFDPGYIDNFVNKALEGAGLATGEDAAKTVGTLIRAETAPPPPTIPKSTAGTPGALARLPAAASTALKTNVLGVPAYVLLGGGVALVLVVALIGRRR
jgi:hypothetical protein